MSKSGVPPIFGPYATPVLVKDIPPPAPDPREAKVAKVHAEILKGTKPRSLRRDGK